MLPPHDQWVGGNSAGPHTSTVDKLLIHTTEGTSIAGAIGAYTANNSWPHLTVDCRVGQPPIRCGHLDMDVAARALRNEPGGVQTNTDGVIQIEVVGFAANPDWIDWAWFGANVAGPICASKHIPVESNVHWVAYPASYGKGAAQRLSPAAWTDVKGLVGHQHVPENSHGDPGAIPILVILAAAKPPPPPASQEDHQMRLVHCPGRETVNDPAGNPVDVTGRWYWLTPDGKRFWVSAAVFAKTIVDDHERGGAKVYYAGRGQVGDVANAPLPLEITPVSLDNLYEPLRPGIDY